MSTDKTTQNDEFWGGIWWVPNGDGKVRDATPGECADEIKRLRKAIADIAEATDCGMYWTARKIAQEAWEKPPLPPLSAEQIIAALRKADRDAQQIRDEAAVDRDLLDKPVTI